jgi:hypothetical protein
MGPNKCGGGGGRAAHPTEHWQLAECIAHLPLEALHAEAEARRRAKGKAPVTEAEGALLNDDEDEDDDAEVVSLFCAATPLSRALCISAASRLASTWSGLVHAGF